MNVLPRDICEKLVERGCKSESGFFYVKEGFEKQKIIQICPGGVLKTDDPISLRVCPAFIFQDFCGISKQSETNMRLLWTTEHKVQEELYFPRMDVCICGSVDNKNSIPADWTIDQRCWKVIQFKMLKMTQDEWVEFMRRAVG